MSAEDNDTSLDAALSNIAGANPSVAEEWEQIVQLQLVPALKVMKQCQHAETRSDPQLEFDAQKYHTQNESLTRITATILDTKNVFEDFSSDVSMKREACRRAVSTFEAYEDEAPLSASEESSKLQMEMRSFLMTTERTLERLAPHENKGVETSDLMRQLREAEALIMDQKALLDAEKNNSNLLQLKHKDLKKKLGETQQDCLQQVQQAQQQASSRLEHEDFSDSADTLHKVMLENRKAKEEIGRLEDDLGKVKLAYENMLDECTREINHGKKLNVELNTKYEGVKKDFKDMMSQLDQFKKKLVDKSENRERLMEAARKSLDDLKQRYSMLVTEHEKQKVDYEASLRRNEQQVLDLQAQLHAQNRNQGQQIDVRESYYNESTTSASMGFP